MPPEVVVDAKALVRLGCLGAQLPQKRDVLAGVFLRVLRNEQRKLEVVHAERDAKELLGVREKDDVLARLVGQRKVRVFVLQQDTQAALVVGHVFAQVRSEHRREVAALVDLQRTEERVAHHIHFAGRVGRGRFADHGAVQRLCHIVIAALEDPRTACSRAAN